MDAQSDVWALGATLFFLLSGQPVHVAKHPTAMLLASASARPRSLADAAPELPRSIIDVVDRAVAYRKADRWSDVAAMRSAWQEAHPAWLPTLPPPSFVPDPMFVDPGLLLDEAGRRRDASRTLASPETPMAITLFDPRELVLEIETSLPRSSLGPTMASRAPAGAPPPPRRWRGTLALAATAMLTAGLVAAAVVLSAEDEPSAARSADPPAPAMDLPVAAPTR